MTPAEIRAAREALGLSLDGLAEALGVRKMSVWRWEQPEGTLHHREPPPYLRRALVGPSVKRRPRPL
jgi:transcriptional regulator with XRE-family HTH domain